MGQDQSHAADYLVGRPAIGSGVEAVPPMARYMCYSRYSKGRIHQQVFGSLVDEDSG